MKLPIKRSTALILQAGIVLICIAALVFMLWEPHLEGRNAHATLFEIYFTDPFLAYAYIASGAFFVALYHMFKVVGQLNQAGATTQATVKALRTITYCAVAMIGFVVGGEIFILFSDSDDRAGGVFMGLLITLGSLVMAITATRLERSLQQIVDKNSRAV